jgi:hypothetical protein
MIDEAFEVATTHDLINANEQIKYVFKIKNTAGIVGINACGDGAVALSEKQEAQPIANGVGG